MAKDYKKELDDLVSTVQKEGGSDLHLAEGRNPTIRVAGSLIPILKKEPFTKDDIWGVLDIFFTPENKRSFLTKNSLILHTVTDLMRVFEVMRTISRV